MQRILGRSSPANAPSLHRACLASGKLIGWALVLACAVLVVPVGVEASDVTIVDPSTTNKARVDSATSSLRVGGITKKLLDKSGSGNATFAFASAAYSKLRIFATYSGCSGFCAQLTLQCVEGSTKTCNLVSRQVFDQAGYDTVSEIPGATVKVFVEDVFGVGGWHVVVYGRAP
jgi:hypothetical protein